MKKNVRRKKRNTLFLFAAGFLAASFIGLRILLIYLLFWILLIGISFLYFYLLPSSLPCTLEIPGTCRKGDEVAGRLYVVQNGRLPIFHGEARILLKNHFSGQEERISLDIMLMGREEGISAFHLHVPYLGMMEILLESAEVCGLFGIGRKKILSSMKKYLMVLPDTRSMILEIPPLFHPDPEGEEVREAFMGYDPGLYQGIRPYQNGDPLRNIHWKMTGKTGEIMVRELGVPAGREPRLFLYTGLPCLDPARIDALMEDYISLSMTLSARGQSHILCWKNEGKEPVEYRVDIPAKLEEILESLYQIVFWQDPGKDRDTRIYYMSYDEESVYGLFAAGDQDILKPVYLRERLWNEGKV